MGSEEAPSKAQVEWTLLGVLRRIAKGTVQPRVGLGEVVAAYHGWVGADNAGFVGEEFDIAQLIGYFYGYDDLEERPGQVSFDGQYGGQGIASLDAAVVQRAQAWLDSRACNDR
jgi:hypothetical protein